MVKVNICLSTYNGDKYLAEQIESIIAQEYQNWQLLVRDDGSSDNTVDIIKDYIIKDSRIMLINDEDTSNVGFVSSFFELLKYTTADYYFFCDQDDVWLPNKISVMLDVMEKEDKKIPIMCYSDLSIVDKDLNMMYPSMIKSQGKFPNITLAQEIITNTVTGCASAINDSLCQLWKNSEGIDFHDWYLALLASSTGKLVFVDESTVFYRQHETNVAGASVVMKERKKLLNILSGIKQSYKKTYNGLQNRSKLLLEYNFRDLSEDDIDFVKGFIDYQDNPFLSRLRKILKYRYSRRNLVRTAIFNILYLFGQYQEY